MPKEADMPPSSSEPMKSDSIRLPLSVWAECQEMAQAGGEKPSEFYRRVITLGLSAERERRSSDLAYQNKLLINKRLQAKEQGAIEALAALTDDSATAEQKANALALIQAWLGES
jgi:hypothetical protein